MSDQGPVTAESVTQTLLELVQMGHAVIANGFLTFTEQGIEAVIQNAPCEDPCCLMTDDDHRKKIREMKIRVEYIQ